MPPSILLPITMLTASFYALMLAWLALQVIKRRRTNEQPLHDGGIVPLQRAIRAHGNFTEYAPLSLIMLALAELAAAPTIILTMIATALAIGRITHAYGLLTAENRSTPNFIYRIRGMQLTLISLIGLAAMLCWLLLERFIFPAIF